ncbi:MAG: hypothetical protein KAT41_05320, partial [Candidatus Marinimicrobia bacterium]|nr:hypothetical protein [Candidatus Neomarinimicrobiota bacterium]
DYWGEPGDDFWNPDMDFDISDYLTPPFSVDSIGISGNSGDSHFSLSMSGKYNAPPPFMYMYENIRGALTGTLKSGYFYGFTNCEWIYGLEEVRGTGVFFYIESNGTGGMIVGEISGSYSTELYDWNASGSLDWVELGSGLTDPGSVAGITDYPRDIKLVSGSDTGDFDIYRSGGIFDSIEEEQYWGFWENHMGATYSTMVDNWSLEWEQEGTECDDPKEMNLRLYMSAKGTTGDRNIDGDMAGGWVDIEYAVTGIAVGDLHGGYNPYSNDIFVGGGGPWLETVELLDMVTNHQDDLAKMNIPGVKIGIANLKGSGNNMTDVTLENVTFLSYASNQAPRIWAAGSMSGTYSDAPTLGQSIKLTDTAGSHVLAADFTVNTWSGNNWDAKIDSAAYTNTLEKTVVAPTTTVNITFKGGAAGAYTSTGGTAGTISGTGAGWVK